MESKLMLSVTVWAVCAVMLVVATILIAVGLLPESFGWGAIGATWAIAFAFYLWVMYHLYKSIQSFNKR